MDLHGLRTQRLARPLLVGAALCALGVSLAPSVARASGFDWGSDCSAGDGRFEQAIPFRQTVTIGRIPAGKRAVGIRLDAANDVDVQLIDVATGTEIIAWPGGLLNDAGEACTDYEGVRYCYSGYNGYGGLGTGHEYIRIEGDTNRELEMRAFGYEAGEAEVNYEWLAVPTCNEVGAGSFTQNILHNATVEVGTIPTGKHNVVIDLDANGADVDVQLFDGNEALIAWPSGQLNGPTEGSIEYRGMTIVYSGYNGINGNWGHERIEIFGRVPSDLTMKAFGYQAGSAQVDYRWGEGVGDTCGGIAALECDEGLVCKEWQTGVSDAAGACHTPTWCLDDATAETECANLFHIAVPGQWRCEQFECVYKTGPVCEFGPEYRYVGNSPEQCQVIRFTCEEIESYFSNACGCGCGPA